MLFFLQAVPTDAFQLQMMLGEVKACFFGDEIFNLLHGTIQVDHFMAAITLHNVMVSMADEAEVVLLFSQIILLYQILFFKKLQSSVNRAEIDGEVLLEKGAVDIVSTDAGMLLLQELINSNTWLGDFNGVLLEDFYGVH